MHVLYRLVIICEKYLRISFDVGRWITPYGIYEVKCFTLYKAIFVCWPLDYYVTFYFVIATEVIT